MPDFHEVQLDVGIDYGMTGGAEFETEIVATAGGRETRGIVYPADLGSWQLGERSIAKATLTYLDGFFRARHGMAYGFRAKIWGDYVLPRQQIGVGNGSQTAFQIYKTYPDPSLPYSKNLKKIVSGSLSVWKNALLQSSGFSLNYDTGVLTFSGPPTSGHAIEVACEYDTPVRFGMDKFTARFDAWDAASGEAHFYISSLPIVEIPV